MRRAAVLPLVLVAALALSGCGRLAAREPVLAPSATATPTPTPSPVAETTQGLDAIEEQLRAVDDDLQQSTNDLANGDEAAGNE